MSKMLLVIVVITAGAIGLAACTEGAASTASQEIVPGGDSQRGRQVLLNYGCEACHTIPGIQGADATVGPPLNAWADRRYIAGTLPNTPAHLIRWIQYPQAVEPGTAMPNMGVTDQDARDMAAYLYTLRQDDMELSGWLD